MDTENGLAPTNKLTPSTISWCNSVGSNARTVNEILSKPDVVVMNAIQDGIDVANRKAVSRAAFVQNWTILPRDLSIATGELGPTLKLKRFEFYKMYEHAINMIYN